MRAVTEKTETLKAKLRSEGEQIFRARMTSMYGSKLDLSKVEYINSQTKVTVRCTTHDTEFEGKPNNLGMGKIGCPECTKLKKHEASKITLTQEEFIRRSREVHGDTYDYTKTVYESAHKKVVITCKLHGDFEQVARAHHKGSGCKKCGTARSTEKQIGCADEFIAAAKGVHGDRYDYSAVVYEGNLVPVQIICPEHGAFYQKPKAHKKGRGCVECGRNRLNGITTKDT